MPSPTTSLATQRPELAASLQEFDLMMDAENFISHRLFPVLDVGKQSGTFGKIKLSSLLQNRESSRGIGANYNRGNWQFDDASYATKEQGVEEPLDDREKEMYRDYFDAAVICTMRAQRVILENQEKRVAAKVFNESTYSPTNITNEWDDYPNATPITDVESKVQAIWAASGLWPNAMVINRKVFRNLRNCAQIIDRLKYQGFVDVRAENINEQALAAVFDIPMLMVAGGTKNIANEGADPSISSIWSDEYAWIGRVARTQDFKEPCVGRIFHWGADGSQERGLVESYREEQTRSEIFRVRHDVDEVELQTTCGGLLGNVTTI
jgi:hypothetical protein